MQRIKQRFPKKYYEKYRLSDYETNASIYQLSTEGSVI